LVATKEALGRVEAQNGDLLARITALEERGAPAPAPAAGAAVAAAPAPSRPPAPTALEARLAELEAKVAITSAAKKAEVEVEDPADLLDYVPYHEGRGLNPHPVWPNGLTNKPQCATSGA
jgi:BMFP domain-containing protein YqiC